MRRTQRCCSQNALTRGWDIQAFVGIDTLIASIMLPLKSSFYEIVLCRKLHLGKYLFINFGKRLVRFIHLL